MSERSGCEHEKLTCFQPDGTIICLRENITQSCAKNHHAHGIGSTSSSRRRFSWLPGQGHTSALTIPDTYTRARRLMLFDGEMKPAKHTAVDE